MAFLDFHDMSYWAFLTFRLACMLLASTWFVPDEIFQSVEVSYNWVFGVGYLSWEWSPFIALRSAIHPSIYAAGYWLMKLVNLDYNWVVNWLPNAINACIFAAADVCYLSFLKRFFRFNKKAITPAMALYISSWFILYCSTRSLSNTLETALILMALKWYTFGEVYRRINRVSTAVQSKPSSGIETIGHDDSSSEHEQSFDRAVPFGSPYRKNSRFRKQVQKFKECYGDINSFRMVVCFASLAVFIRPTAALIFGPLCAIQLWETSSKFSYVFKAVLPCGFFILLVGIYLDSLYHGSIKFTLVNFVRFNVLEGGSAEFGENVWYWYLVNGLPAVLTLLCIPLVTYLLRSVYQSVCEEKIGKQTWVISSRFFWTALFYVFVHSFIAHKEQRFLLPIIPLLIPTLLAEIEHYSRYVKKYFKAITIVLNIGMALYIGLIHQRGPNLAARIVLREVLNASRLHGAGSATPYHIFYLMPCFSMPMYARLHRYNDFVQIHMLDCMPSSAKPLIEQTNDDGIIMEEFEDYVSPSDEFFMDEMRYLRNNWNKVQLDKIQLIVLYEHTFRRIETFLESHGFVEKYNFFHTHFINSRNEDGRIVIVKRVGNDGDINGH